MRIQKVVLLEKINPRIFYKACLMKPLSPITWLGKAY